MVLSKKLARMLSLPEFKLDPKGSVRKEQCVVDGVHAFADGVAQLELAQDGRDQDVHVLLGESETEFQKNIDGF